MGDEKTGVYIDLEKSSYKKVREFCVKNDLYVKEFVRQCLKEGMKNAKTNKRK